MQLLREALLPADDIDGLGFEVGEGQRARQLETLSGGQLARASHDVHPHPGELLSRQARLHAETPAWASGPVRLDRRRRPNAELEAVALRIDRQGVDQERPDLVAAGCRALQREVEVLRRPGAITQADLQRHTPF